MKRSDVQLIREIRAYLDQHLYQRHRIQDLCRRFMINREKLQQGFRELFHSTVHSYVVRQRLQRAAQRLLETDESIKSIALNSGYKKQRSFNKTFKSVYHLTPATYRKVHQKKEETSA